MKNRLKIKYLLVVLLFGLLIVACSDSDNPVSTLAQLPVSGDYGYLDVNVSPSDAYVQISTGGDAFYFQHGNVSALRLKEGNYVVKVLLSDYVSEVYNVELLPRTTKSISCTLAKSSTLNITVTPVNANCTLLFSNGLNCASWVGNKSITELRAGSYILKVNSNDYDSSEQSINLSEGEIKNVSVSLTAQLGSLYLTLTPSSAGWRLSNSTHTYSGTGNSINDVFNGDYSLIVGNTGYLACTTKVKITKGLKTYKTIQMVADNLLSVGSGSFTMGSGAYTDEPSHTVSLNSFSIGASEVTVKDYRAFCVSTEKAFPNYTLPWGWNDTDPMVALLFSEVIEYCNWVGCRLPTEAEWEYAAKGGQYKNTYTYSGSSTIGNVAWYTTNSSNKVHTVKTKSSNILGLYDMTGNVWEYCNDWYSSSYYSISSSSNPTGPSYGTTRVMRGGSYNSSSDYSKNTFRSWAAPDTAWINVGFRLAK